MPNETLEKIARDAQKIDKRQAELGRFLAFLRMPSTIPIRMAEDDLAQIIKRNLERFSPNQTRIIEPKVIANTRVAGPGVTISFTINLPKEDEERILKETSKGRYFELHGPGGKVRITTNVEVMKKAKKQGIHVQMKYKLPNGKRPVKEGFYTLVSGPGSMENQSKRLLNENSPAVQAALEDFSRRMQQSVFTIFESSRTG